MRHYELVVVLSPMISPDEASQAWERIKGYITNREADIVHEERWGTRRLAYPVKKGQFQFLEGNYHLTRFTADNAFNRELENYLKLDEHVLRSLVTVTVSEEELAAHAAQTRAPRPPRPPAGAPPAGPAQGVAPAPQAPGTAVAEPPAEAAADTPDTTPDAPAEQPEATSEAPAEQSVASSEASTEQPAATSEASAEQPTPTSEASAEPESPEPVDSLPAAESPAEEESAE